MLTKSITIHATYKDIRLPSEHLRTLLFASNVAEEVVNGCELALHELLTNLVDHAYEGDASQLIMVNIACNETQIMIETQDAGKPPKVDLSNVTMPDPSELAEGGYGVSIIQMLMTEVKYKTEQGTNTWQLVKKL